MAEVSPDQVPASVKAYAARLRAATAANPAPPPPPATPEQGYERMVGKLPRSVRSVTPGTIGEAGFGIGALATALGSIAGAPETGGISLLGLAPMAGALMGGAMEDPRHPLHGASIEGVKGLGQELGGRILGKGAELAERFIGKNAMLSRSAARIGQSLPKLFGNYPLRKVPTTAKELEEHIGGGKVADAAGTRLGNFRSMLKKRFGEYTPAVPAKLVDASSAGPAHYTMPIPAKGEFVDLPVLGADGKVTIQRMGIGEGAEYVQELYQGGRTTTGNQKGTTDAPKLMELAHKSQDILANKLDQLEPRLGQDYVLHSHDYAMAKQLQKVFAGSTRTTSTTAGRVGVINQPAILGRTEKAAAKMNQIRPDTGTKLTRAVAPTGAAAAEEVPWGGRFHGSSEGGIRGLFHPPIPFNPETRKLMPFIARVLSDPRNAPLLGSIGLQAGEDVLGTKNGTQNP